MSLITFDESDFSDDSESRRLRLDAFVLQHRREQAEGVTSARWRAARMARRQAENESSDTEADNLPTVTSDNKHESTTDKPATKMNDTPNGDTAEVTKKIELVKLDPAEVGMSTTIKHLYSGKEDKRGRFQW